MKILVETVYERSKETKENLYKNLGEKQEYENLYHLEKNCINIWLKKKITNN